MEQQERYTFLIDKETQSTRIDSVLSLLLSETSRSFIQRLIEGGNLTVNGQQCTSKKYKVSEGDLVKVEKLAGEAGDTVTFDQVVALSDGTLKAGKDVAGATVTAKVVEQGKSKKVIVYKYKRKTGYHKKNGHRQAYTQVKIEKINA